ncbi:MAG: DUF523 and DUF1722 domain-containing protein [Planctomycetota bacterium]|nr:DUF523 and DUF1722 domain-containing protein [Planctomycetota bacterium]
MTHDAGDVHEHDVRIGVSACLLGRNVRMNGGHCRESWLTDVLSEHVDFVPVCPEVEMGLPVPRPTMRLISPDGSEDVDRIRMVVTKTGEDVTDTIDTWSQEKLDELEAADLHGFVLKKSSPSCGVFRVKVYDAGGMPRLGGQGRFAAALTARFPNLPVEEDGRLNDRELRESFLVRVFAYARWKRYLAEDASAKGLIDFHAVHKYALLAADPAQFKQLGRLVARAGVEDLAEVQAQYETGFMAALTEKPTRGRHVNVLQHLLGFVREELTGDDKRELERMLELYRSGNVPRAAPLALVRHLLRSHAAPTWALDQIYLRPYAQRLHRNEAV